MSRKAVCDFCYHTCHLSAGQTGLCGVRRERDGGVISLGYGEIVASAVDPVEKKPMYHLYPGEKTFSIALFGCNLTCSFCQNHRISQKESPYCPGRPDSIRQVPYTAQEAVNEFMETGTRIMSYTYSEPIVWQDFALKAAELVHERGGINCVVTNGTFSPASLGRFMHLSDAFNIDLKGDEEFYRNVCGGSQRPVLSAIEKIAGNPSKVLEVTTLVIEGYHNAQVIRMIGKALASRGVKVWHLSRFHPQYRMHAHTATSEQFLSEMLKVAEDSGIPFIYAGNSGLSGRDRTLCPSCGTALVSGRRYLESRVQGIERGRCTRCGEPIYGRFA